MTDWDSIVASLPDPEKDPMPPRVRFDKKGYERSQRDKEFYASLLNTRTDTERLAKYILEGRLFGGSFRKDGDWLTHASGRRFYQKKVSDFVGSVPYPERPNAACYVEVKGVSPGQPFQFHRLDVRNNPKKPSQQEKLTKQWEYGDLVWLFIGWWLTNAQPIPIVGKNRTIRRWRKAECCMVGTLLQWSDWLDIYENHKYRSIRQKDLPMLDDYRIYKEGGMWRLDDNHWWKPCQ